MDEPSRNRIGLWIRGERAFGLSVVGPIPRAGGIALALSQAPSAPTPGGADEVPGLALFGAGAPPASSVSVPPQFGSPAPISPPVSPTDPGTPLTLEEKRQRLAVLNDTEVSVCKKCRLCETRTQTVFGEGDPDAKIFFIGEGPGETEDNTGRPFVGRAGELLNKQIAAMGLRREQVFIANIVKCRPPNNRVPAPDEVATCTPYLERQLEIVGPRVIVTLGLPAAKYMLKTTSTMGRLRGQWQDWRGIKLMPTYHPAFLLRSPTYENRSAVWSDLQKVMGEVGLTPKKAPDGGG